LRRVDGGYLPAERLTPAIVGSHPAVAPDESFIVFSGRFEGGAGGTDLYVIFKGSDGSWTTPTSMGPAVNTRHVESSPTLSSDGRFLFFSRQQQVWWVDASVIDALRPAGQRRNIQ
jgi:Tol biopolymer transport system component